MAAEFPEFTLFQTPLEFKPEKVEMFTLECHYIPSTDTLLPVYRLDFVPESSVTFQNQRLQGVYLFMQCTSEIILVDGQTYLAGSLTVKPFSLDNAVSPIFTYQFPSELHGTTGEPPTFDNFLGIAHWIGAFLYANYPGIDGPRGTRDYLLQFGIAATSQSLIAPQSNLLKYGGGGTHLLKALTDFLYKSSTSNSIIYKGLFSAPQDESSFLRKNYFGEHEIPYHPPSSFEHNSIVEGSFIQF